MKVIEDVILLHKKNSKKLFTWFFLLNTIVLGLIYKEMFLNIGLTEFQANINGILLTNYYIWFLGIISIILIININLIYLDKTKLNKIFSYYIYLLSLTFILVLTFQLFVHFFIPISFIDTIRILGTVVFFNIIYYFILIVLTLTIKNIKNKHSSLILFCIYLIGFIFTPLLKLTSNDNILTRIFKWYDFNIIFGRLYLYIASNILNLPFAYSINYTEFVFKHILLNLLLDKDYFNLYFSKTINYPFILLFSIILILTLTFIITRNKSRL